MEEIKGVCKKLREEAMVQLSQQHDAPCVKGVDWGLGTRGLRMVAAFWASIPVKVTQEAGVNAVDVLSSGHPFSRLLRYAGNQWAYSKPHPHSVRILGAIK